MRESPRLRRLRADLRAMEKLRAESTILDFAVPGALFGGPPESYQVKFLGRGFWRPSGSSDTHVLGRHEVIINLGASYPRMMPELNWKSPIFHPNISAGGIVCLGGYSTHWVPSLTLDELCTMLWDMVRYQNFDVESPYNREAAIWARSQHDYHLPVDGRPIRDRLVRAARPVNGSVVAPIVRGVPMAPNKFVPNKLAAGDMVIDDVVIIDDVEPIDAVHIVDAEVVEQDQDIVFLD